MRWELWTIAERVCRRGDLLVLVVGGMRERQSRALGLGVKAVRLRLSRVARARARGGRNGGWEEEAGEES